MLAINDDKTVHHDKIVYGAVQNLAAIFDDTLRRTPKLDPKLGRGKGTNCTGHAYLTKKGKPLVALWRSKDIPGDRTKVERAYLTLKKVKSSDPVWIDLLSDSVYTIDKSLWKSTGEGTTSSGVEVYDSPVLLAERSGVASRITAKDAP